MVGWIAPVVLLGSLHATALAPVETSVPPAPGPDAAPATDAAEPAVVAPPDAEPEPAAEPEPFDEPSPQPEPAVATTTSSGVVATDDEVAPRAVSRHASDDDDAAGPVVLPEQGQWGMQFTFGGLAPMSIAGIRDFGVNRLLFTELGFRRVLGNGWVVPFSIGAGVFSHSPDEGAKQNDVGLSAAVGVRKWFRVWRRISPFVGGDVRLSYLDPSGDNNWLVGFGIGPDLGIEYFVGDRVSLLLQGDATIGVNVFDGLVQVGLATQVSFGGQTGLVFYF